MRAARRPGAARESTLAFASRPLTNRVGERCRIVACAAPGEFAGRPLSTRPMGTVTVAACATDARGDGPA
ncbi:MAG: hypothetical protein O9972_37960 [Burkholderiales bacterium]|nr:hypothetical protein [Burkholderiales bacterium]